MFKIIRKLFIKKTDDKKVLEKVEVNTPFEKKPRSKTKNKGK